MAKNSTDLQESFTASGASKKTALKSARRIILTGYVQSVGFRPFIYRIAKHNDLTGWVKNCVGEVQIHVEGQAQKIDRFVDDIFNKKPALAKPELRSSTQLTATGFEKFSIEESEASGNVNVRVPADLYICDDCLTEMNDPTNRRYRYPFINCTQCGPRYTLITALPYDRLNTTMQGFKLCPKCEQEYQNPSDRRFHAEPIACPDCGPSLRFKLNDFSANVVSDKQHSIGNNEASLQKALSVLREGKVLAVKGVGGYHLMCDATDATAVERLRKNKKRPDKPLAVMFPADLDDPFKVAKTVVDLSFAEREFLQQAARPLLLVKKIRPAVIENNNSFELALNIASGLNEVGVMLPYSPLHHLLLNDFKKPLVATSANLSGEPVLTDNVIVEQRLAHVADAFLHHDRPIERPADDPVYRSIAGKARPIRLGRGVAPLEMELPFRVAQPLLAVGAHMKNTIALAWGNRVVVSPHIGEMGSLRSLDVFEKTINDLQHLYQIKAERVICDAHADYATTRWANKQSLPVNRVYHHYAHASAAYAESNVAETHMVFSWDGVGYGEDGTLWGGETFIGKPGDWKRVATMRPFFLPGADKAGRQPWRSAAAVCWEAGLTFDTQEGNEEMLKLAWQRKINSPQTSSVGRLFDAAAALTGVRRDVSFEGQGPMELEACCNDSVSQSDYVELELSTRGELLVTDWCDLLPMLSDKKLSLSDRANRFHHSMARVILQQAKTIREKSLINHVTFSGGVFQNRVLTELAIDLLLQNDFTVSYPELIPVNDAGISFGQIIEYGFSTLSE